MLQSTTMTNQETDALWQKVAKAAAAEASYQPPPQKVRAVKSAFTMTGPASKRRETGGLLPLCSDSFLQPALRGVRSCAVRLRPFKARGGLARKGIDEIRRRSNLLRVAAALNSCNHLALKY